MMNAPIVAAAAVADIKDFIPNKIERGSPKENETCTTTTNANDNQAMTNALAASESMFKTTNDIAKNQPSGDCPPWPMTKICPADFYFATPASIPLPAPLGMRSYEYGASWVEHYYRPLVQLAREYNKPPLVELLYCWYMAQFTLDYLHDVHPLTRPQFLYASYVISTDKDDSGGNGNRQSRPTDTSFPHPRTDKTGPIIEACRELMQRHNAILDSLPTSATPTIHLVLQSFYDSVAEQCHHRNQQQERFDRMSLHDFVEYRTVNAGGLMGFVRQVHLVALLDDTNCHEEDDWKSLARLVGLNVALVNDLYGIRKDQSSGEPNIIWKHQQELQCSLQESIDWAKACIHATVQQVRWFQEQYPRSVCSRYHLAMGCISGNHGFHESCQRYELPPGFSWKV